MKNLQDYIKESVETSKDLPSDTVKAVTAVAEACRKVYNKLTYTKDFKKNKENEKIVVDYIKENKLCPEYIFLTTKEYYEGYFDPDSKYNDNSAFDGKYGDIIVLDDTDSEVAYIDLKLGDKFLGAISYGSLSQFEVTGVYVCVNLSNGSVKAITHKKVNDFLKEHPECLQKKSEKNTSKSREVNGVIGKFDSEDFVPGKVIRSI